MKLKKNMRAFTATAALVLLKAPALAADPIDSADGSSTKQGAPDGASRS